MKQLLALFITLLISLSVSAEETSKDPAIEVATHYFTALTIGDIDTADRLVGLPSSFMRIENIFTTSKEVMAFHRDIFNQKGKRDVPKTEVSKPTYYPKLDKETFPGNYEVVSMKFLEGKYKGDSLKFYVKNDDGVYKVIGLFQ